MTQIVGFEPKRARDIAKATLMVLNNHKSIAQPIPPRPADPLADDDFAPIRGKNVTSLHDNR